MSGMASARSARHQRRVAASLEAMATAARLSEHQDLADRLADQARQRLRAADEAERASPTVEVKSGQVVAVVIGVVAGAFSIGLAVWSMGAR